MRDGPAIGDKRACDHCGRAFRITCWFPARQRYCTQSCRAAVYRAAYRRRTRKLRLRMEEVHA